MTEKKVYFNKPQRLTQLIGTPPLLSPDEEQAKRLPQRQIRRELKIAEYQSYQLKLE